ncbi:MAG: hypothetical protein MI866_22110, partial [Bacteroidales bacterium]|nr:hypothetical protein [Bacteroidales bacterium]
MMKNLHKMKSWLVAMVAIVALMGASADAIAQYEGTSVDVSFYEGDMSFDLSGTYDFNAMLNDKPSYTIADTPAGAGPAIIFWDGTQWVFALGGDVGGMTLSTNSADSDLVPQNGWVDASGMSLEIGTYSGNGTDPYAGTTVDVSFYEGDMSFDLSGTYDFNAMLNNKPSYTISDTPAGAGPAIIYWDGTQWVFALGGDVGGMTLSTNSTTTELVPQNGWVDASGMSLNIGSYSGNGTVNNTPTAITDVVPGFEMKLYPNPATNYVMLELNEVANLTIYST